MEKPGKLYNEQGQVNDPEIAREMAKYENSMREDGGTQEDIDSTTDHVGKREKILQELSVDKKETAEEIVEILSNVLTKWQKQVLKEYSQEIIEKL